MKNKIKNTLFLVILLIAIIFTSDVKAADAYQVVVISSNGNEQQLQTFGDYYAARNLMLSHNSDINNVAVVKLNGEILSAKYAIVRFRYDTNYPWAENANNEHRLFSSATDATNYTTTHAAYGNDAAFIEFEPNVGGNGRAKIKLSGSVSWVNRGYYDVIPLSKLYASDSWVASKDATWFKEIGNNQIQQTSTGNITIRNGPSTSAAAVGTSTKGAIHSYTDKTYSAPYTWYKIGTVPLKTYYKVESGELKHYFATASTQGVSNLGKAPGFLNGNTTYYSFDGNYFYTNLIHMLDDYRNGSYDHSINASGPYYPYYLYLSNHSRTSYTADDFNQIVINKGHNASSSKMYGEGANFILSQERYGVNALLTFSAAVNESATGTSAIAMQKNNLFGHNAYGNDPLASATYYNTVAEGIMAHASMTGAGYNNPTDYRYFGGHYGNKQSGMNVKYATDPYWGEKMASNAYASDKSFGFQEWQGSTIGIKAGVAAAAVKKSPDHNSQTIYQLKNGSFDVWNMGVIVTDKVFSNGTYWFKIYTDVALDDHQNVTGSGYNFDKSYGYVEASQLYVTNQQPTIHAQDIVVEAGSSLDLMKNVSASDPENGDITSSIQVSGTVYINQPGVYPITYTAVDHQQFQVSKTIHVTVKEIHLPEIFAEDQIRVQNTSFDPKEGIKATDKTDGDITNQIEVIENTVNINQLGEYKVTYKVTNSFGKSTTKTIKVTIVQDGTLPSVLYQTHVQDIGWQDLKKDGEMSGTSEQSLRLEALKISVSNYGYTGNIEYQTHIQNIGWEESFKKNGEMSGTSEQSLRLEAIRIKLSGDLEQKFDVYYRVHSEDFGWLDWAKNGEEAGTAGFAYRLEAIEIKLVKKDSSPPGNTTTPFKQTYVGYAAHVENIGWQEGVVDGQVAGTEAQALQLEAIQIHLSAQRYTGNIEYQSHIQNIGWETDWKRNKETSGTVGRKLRLEAIRIRLTGEMANQYDIYCRVHVQGFGWLDWAKNGQEAGSAGYGYRAEAMQVVLVKKGSAAPGPTNVPYKTK